MGCLSLWRTAVSRDADTAGVAGWLREPGSLTARLMRQGRFRIVVLNQRLHHAHADECAMLGLQRNAPCHVREVALYCDDVPVIFAHTVLPVSPRGVLTRWFAGLGSRSLGSLLFAHPGFKRGVLAFARIDMRHPLYAMAARLAGSDARASFAARRCLHRYGRQAVLVSEVFLPAISQFRK